MGELQFEGLPCCARCGCDRHWKTLGHGVHACINCASGFTLGVDVTRRMRRQMSPINAVGATLKDVARRQEAGERVFIVAGKVYALADDFKHPGGSKVRTFASGLARLQLLPVETSRCCLAPSQALEAYRGQDVTDVFEGHSAEGHAHSLAAHSLLAKYYIGDLVDAAAAAPGARQGPSSAHAPSPAHDDVAIDESQPLLWQVGRLGEGYMAWVHQPVPGQPRFFHSEWAERVTKVHWWVVPLLWLPLVAYSLVRSTSGGDALAAAHAAALLALGMVVWQGMEYSLHRFLFHQQPRGPVSIFLHFLLHGCHHKYPMDVERLVFPPVPASWVAAAVYGAVHAALPRRAAAAVFAGIILGYVIYDCMHYLMHSGALGGPLKAAHMQHHYVDAAAGFGISSPLFDMLLGTGARRATAKRML